MMRVGPRLVSLFTSGLLLFTVALLPSIGGAQEPVVSNKRIAVTKNIDFPGADIGPVFDTTFSKCRQICLGNDACVAFTFNSKASVCFPKTEIADRQPFDGAFSAWVIKTSQPVLTQQKSRLESLGFMPGSYLTEARQQAENLGGAYLSNEWSADQLVTASRNAARNGKLRDAYRFMGAALNLTDDAAGWAEMADLALGVKPSNGTDKRKLLKISTSAALNAFLRAQNKAVQVTALNTLALGVERRGLGRLSISVLRLAQAISPRLDAADALVRAISLYGVRIAEHTIDNNAVAPRVCVTFSEDLVPAGVDYAPFVRTSEPGLPVDVKGRQLCVAGVVHGSRYRLTFRKGLPAASGEKLSKSVDLSVYVRDRDPSARFVGRAYLLPKGKSAAIPIVTVNLSEVDLKIRRVGERNLVRIVQNGTFGSPLANWEEDALKNRLGTEVWSGTADVSRNVNKDVTTALPIGDAISNFEPGVYAISARVPGENASDSTAATQWFIVTDLGLSTMNGGDGLHVFVRSLNTVAAQAGARVRLVAVNNEVLAETTTDSRGYAHFAPGLTKGQVGLAPALVTVSLADDFAFLSLTDSAFDLSDRGVAGRVSPPPIDVFMATDRGAYRVGETAYTTVLARDGKASALAGLALTAIVTRPDGVEFLRRVLPDTGGGGRVLAVPLPQTAPRGTWTIRIHADPKGDALASAQFLVEDFVPERIDFDLALQPGPITINDVPLISVDAKYLYGAPGADLTIEAESRVSVADGLDGFAGYHFGRQDEPFTSRVAFNSGTLKTDAKGAARFGLAMPKRVTPSRPLKLRALVRVSEGSGRPVERTIERNLAPQTPLLGIKPLFDGTLAEGATAEFNILAVGSDLKQHAMARVGWTLNRVRTRYQWYESYGNWRYEPITTRTRIASGETALSADGPTAINGAVDWGHYEVKLETLSGPYLSASYDFYAGWYASANSATTPDTLEIGLDKAQYAIGETAHLRLVPRYSGVALVSVVSNHLIAMKTVSVTKGENLIDLPVTEEWGSGAYVTVSVVRPMDVAGGHNPARSLGLNWARIDPGKHRLNVAFASANEVSPRATMTAALKVTGLVPGEQAFATIAAVDVGILNLTAFKSPDPVDHYFGQRKLGMDIRDVYGRLIDGLQGNPGHLRSGGDSPMAERLQSPPPTEDLVAFFSGPISVGPDGTVSADFDIPAFNGTIRLMAIVWSATGVGQADKEVLARDPIVVTASLPKFLAPYDQSRVLLEIAHATGPTGEVGLEISADGGLFVDTSGVPETVTLRAGEKVSVSVPMTAPASGTPLITVSLTTPGGKHLKKTLRVPIRANDPEVARTARVALADGVTFTLSEDVFAGYIPGSGHATLAVGPIAQFDAVGLLDSLDRYPYGCTEQITSKALPLLYFGDLATSLGLAQKKNVSTRIDQAIAEVLSNQSSSGAFGLWRPGNGDLWLDSYVSDFLSRARGKGFTVPAQAFRLAMDNLRNQINYAQDFEKGGEGIAYALMVLAREGAANIGDLRYYADTKSDAFGSPLALAQIGAALAYYGDQIRADDMFRRAAKRLDQHRIGSENPFWRNDYGTDLRDTAAVLTLAAEAGTNAIDQQALARRISPDALVGRARSTQENMWSLMAANALIDETPANAFLVDGAPSTGPVVQVLDAQTGAGQTVLVKNISGKTVPTILTTYGVPSDAEPAGGNGYSIARDYYTIDGQSVTSGHVALNTRLVVVLKITPKRQGGARLIVNDPLPAGFEIDNPNLLRSGDIAALDWLKPNTKTRHTEFRADRFIAAVDWTKTASFQLAYIVRAISPGRFHHPAASVEDMYRPQFRARTAPGDIVISAN